MAFEDATTGAGLVLLRLLVPATYGDSEESLIQPTKRIDGGDTRALQYVARIPDV